MRSISMRIPHPKSFRRAPGMDRENVCPICGRRVNKPVLYIRHLAGWMFPAGVLPDEGAAFSAVHPRCVQRFSIGEEYVYSAGAKTNLETDFTPEKER